jgi:alpha-D-xyloside xylohydrolase
MKKIYLLYLSLAVFLVLTSCRRTSYEIQDDGIILQFKPTDIQNVRLLRIQVLSDDIFRVTATPGKTFASNESLSAILKPDKKKNWSVRESRDSLEIITRTTRVTVLLKTCTVAFYDSTNRLIVKENTNGRNFSPISVHDTNGYTMRQVFDSPDEEGLYGLGQHQSEEFNYKGKNEELFQYNTKVSMPFIVSTGNYGILWDNYSLTRFGDARNFSQLSVFKLFDAQGNEGGLTATYYEHADSGKVFTVRQEKEIDYENLETVKNFPGGFPFNRSMITWEGQIEAPQSGTYRFGLYYAGYTKLWIDGQLLTDKWRTAWNPNLSKFNVDMKQGEKHSIKLEWKPDGGISYIGLRVHTPVNSAEQNKISFWSEMGDEIDYYFIRGNGLDEVISGLRKLTGKAQVMPKWAMGFWQSRERYKTQEELLSVLAEFRKRKIPVDNIVMDWFYWPEDSWGSHEFDTIRFPNPKEMIQKVHEHNAHFMISVWPKFYYTTEHYRELEKIGAMYLQATRDSVRDWVGKGYVGSFYDAYNEEGRKLFWKQMDDHFGGLGIDAWWMDASEPDILSNSGITYRKKLMDPTALGPSTKYFNAYALMNARGIYEGSRKSYPDQRVFLLTRSGFTGLQRYAAATWSGDIASRWEDMRAQIPAGINYSMSGNPYWTMDIGGFCVEYRFSNAREGSPELDEWRELNARWTQFGAFAPLYRTHGQFPLREVFNLAPEYHPAFKSIVYYDKLRYRLMPYIYSLNGMVWLNDYTIMRGLVMDFSSDTMVYDIGDQYMYGPSFLVCPVHTYKAREREVYLPAGCGWFDFYTGRFIEGNQKISVPAPYERMPLFIKSGSIIPIGPELEYTSQKPADPIILFVYTGANASFNLYEDDGNTYGYENGKYSVIPIHYNESTGELTIDKRKGEFPGMIRNRTFQVVWISKEKPVGYLPDIKPKITLPYSGQKISVIK